MVFVLVNYSIVKMISAMRYLAILLLIGVVSFGAQGSDGNQYCDSDPRFGSLNCPPPNVCYFKDRLGNVACCPAGQKCESAPNNPPAYLLNGASSLGGRITKDENTVHKLIHAISTVTNTLLLLPFAMMAWQVL